MQEPVKLKIWNKRNRVKLCKYDKSAFRILFEELSVQRNVQVNVMVMQILLGTKLKLYY